MSKQFNLIPYREEQRRVARRQFNLGLILVFGLGVATLLFSHGILSNSIAAQSQRNEIIVGQNKILDQRIEEIKRLQGDIDVLKARKAVIERLQLDRSGAVKILDQLARLTPNGVFVNSLKQKGSVSMITGYSINSDLVAELMLSLGSSKHLGNVNLVEIKSEQVGARRLFHYTVTFEQIQPGDVAAESATADKAIKPSAARAPLAPSDTGAGPAHATAGAAPGAPTSAPMNKEPAGQKQ